MKILSITAQKPDSTGSGVYLSEMVKAFDRAGHEQWVIAGITKEDQPDLPGSVDLSPVYYETSTLPYAVLGMSDEMPYCSTRYRDLTKEMIQQFETAFETTLCDVLKRFDPDVIICHHLYLLTSIVRDLAPDKTVVAVCHGTDIRQMKQHDLERGRILDAIMRLDRIFALHDEQKEEIVSVYGVDPEKVFVVGTGYNHELFHARGRAVRTKHSVDTDRTRDIIRLVYVGKIWEKKGVISLIKALDHLPYEPGRIHLEMIGGHSHEAEYKQIVDRARMSSYEIRFRGRLPQPDVAEIYRQSEVFILPSFFEGLPLVLIEALACGCKIVTTDLPGIQPWLNSRVPEAIVHYVEPPRMVDVDEPLPDDLPLFEQRLAHMIQEAIEAQDEAADMSVLSWDAMCRTFLNEVGKSQTMREGQIEEPS